MKAKVTEQPKIVISFDLIVKECKAVFDGSRSKAYSILKKELAEHGFTHDNGSGYISEKGLSRLELLDSLNNVITRQPWLEKCCKRLRISEAPDDLLNGLAHKELIGVIAAQSGNSISIPQIPTKQSDLLTPKPPSFAEIAEQNKSYRPPQKPRTSSNDNDKKPPNKGSTGR